MARTRARRRRKSSIVRIGLLLVCVALVAVPYAWIVLTAFKRPVDAAAVPPKIFSPVSLRNWEALIDSPFMGSLVNTAVIVALTTSATLALGVLAGYAVARGRFRGRNLLIGMLLASRLVPPVIFIVPLFLFFFQLQLINTYVGLMLAYMTGLLPFTIWLVSSYFVDTPLELEEAALIDGASKARAFYSVALPIAMPGVVSVGLLIAIACIGEYYTPLLLAGFDTTPAAVGLVNFVGGDTTNWGAMAAASLTLLVPAVVLTLLAQRGLVRGISAGAVKG